MTQPAHEELARIRALATHFRKIAPPESYLQKLCDLVVMFTSPSFILGVAEELLRERGFSTISLRDERVLVMHSAKRAAEFQSAPIDNPSLWHAYDRTVFVGGMH